MCIDFVSSAAFSFFFFIENFQPISILGSILRSYCASFLCRSCAKTEEKLENLQIIQSNLIIFRVNIQNKMCTRKCRFFAYYLFQRIFFTFFLFADVVTVYYYRCKLIFLFVHRCVVSYACFFILLLSHFAGMLNEERTQAWAREFFNFSRLNFRPFYINAKWLC